MGLPQKFTFCNRPAFMANPPPFQHRFPSQPHQGELRMIVTFKAGTPQSQIDSLIRWLQSQGVQAHWSAGEYHTVLALVGETGKIDPGLLSSLEIVQSVKADFSALPMLQPGVSAAKYCGLSGRLRGSDWGRQLLPHCRSLFCGKSRANLTGSQRGPSRRGPGSAGRGLQAANLPYAFQGLGPRALPCWWKPSGKQAFPSSAK